MNARDLEVDPRRKALLARRAALLYAAGKTDAEIARDLSMPRATLEILKASPLFQESIQQYATQIEEKGVQSIIDDLVNDWPKNRDFIQRVRDGKEDIQTQGDAARVGLRLKAAKMLLDKQAPNAGERAQAEQAARLIIDGRLLGQALRAMRNVGVIDITPEEIEKATGENLPRILEPKTPEEFKHEYDELLKEDDAEEE